MRNASRGRTWIYRARGGRTSCSSFCAFAQERGISSASSSSPSCLNCSSFSFLRTDSSSVAPPERYLAGLTGGLIWRWWLWHFHWQYMNGWLLGQILIILVGCMRLYTSRFKILKERKQAVQNYGVNSPFTLGTVQGLADGSPLIMAAHDQAR